MAEKTMSPESDGNVIDDAEGVLDAESVVKGAPEFVGDGGVTDDPGVEAPEAEDVPFEQIDGEDGSGI